jgi:hypothetical protein
MAFIIMSYPKLLNREKGYYPEVRRSDGNNPFEIELFRILHYHEKHNYIIIPSKTRDAWAC